MDTKNIVSKIERTPTNSPFFPTVPIFGLKATAPREKFLRKPQNNRQTPIRRISTPASTQIGQSRRQEQHPAIANLIRTGKEPRANRCRHERGA